MHKFEIAWVGTYAVITLTYDELVANPRSSI
jgi:hypothetical protein